METIQENIKEQEFALLGVLLILETMLVVPLPINAFTIHSAILPILAMATRLFVMEELGSE
ncbi:MAG: hypothetical protein DRN17_04635 [Thermoplasmata archaeon]|nr:MAG: hypothetical protein DRN17_04635 [Thermoplasmata archaeon]